jgi:urea transport system substrate-binding protein
MGEPEMVARRLVLVVEDDYDLRELEATCLESADYRVATAREGREALEKVAKEMPEVIFLDMRMPGMDGWAFAREFRARYKHGARIVVVTAAANGPTRASEVGAEGFLGKPFEVADLLEVAARQVAANRTARVPTS